MTLTYIHPDYCKSEGNEIAALVAAEHGLIVVSRRRHAQSWHYELGEDEG